MRLHFRRESFCVPELETSRNEGLGRPLQCRVMKFRRGFHIPDSDCLDENSRVLDDW
jgi:hypothetical protein